MKKVVSPVLLVSAFALSTCTYVVAPNDVMAPAPTSPTYDTTKRVAVVETWMGHFCIACPIADSIINNLEAMYGQSFAAIVIHDRYFAEPAPASQVPPCATGYPNAFIEDFRCATGASYSAGFPQGPQLLVMGMINRGELAAQNEWKYPSRWQDYVDTVTNQTACASIHMNHSYNSSSRATVVTVWGTWLQPYSGTVKIAVMLTEDSLAGWQSRSTGCDSQYVFNHVLRECLNTPGSISGTVLSTGTTTVGTTYSYSLPSPYTLPLAFNDAHCTLIALMYDAVTGEILQAWSENL